MANIPRPPQPIGSTVGIQRATGAGAVNVPAPGVRYLGPPVGKGTRYLGPPIVNGAPAALPGVGGQVRTGTPKASTVFRPIKMRGHNPRPGHIPNRGVMGIRPRTLFHSRRGF